MSQPVIDPEQYARLCDIAYRLCAGLPLPGDDGHDGLLHTGPDPRRAAMAIADIVGARIAAGADLEDDEPEIPEYMPEQGYNVTSVMFLSWPGDPMHADAVPELRDAITTGLVMQLGGPFSVRMADGALRSFVARPVGAMREDPAVREQVLINMGIIEG